MGEQESNERSGLCAEEFFAHGQGISYGMFHILDTHYTEITKEHVSLATDLGKGVKLHLPLIAAPMDTVTNARFCIALALQGGLGAIHFNHQPHAGRTSIDEQVDEITRVKRFQNGFIQDPLAVAPEMTIKQALESGTRYNTGGSLIENFPVTHDGSSNGKLLGLLRKQDYFSGSRLDARVKERMIGLDKLVVAQHPITLAEAHQTLWNYHVPLLLITDNEGCLKYLVTRSDVEKQEQYPHATLDERQRLRVLFAVSTRPEETCERLEQGFAAGADGVIIDTSQGYAFYEKEMIRHIKSKYPEKLIIGGNVSTAEAVRFLVYEGADAYRCGQGIGSICTTAGTIGIAREAATSVYECARAARNTPLKTIADGGMKEVGHIFKALALGAHACMLGGLLAGTEEGPGEADDADPLTGSPVKKYRGMGSKEANVGGMRGYSRIPEGIPRKVIYRGSIHSWVPLIEDGLRHSFEVQNYRTISELHEALIAGKVRFERGVGESVGKGDLIR